MSSDLHWLTALEKLGATVTNGQVVDTQAASASADSTVVCALPDLTTFDIVGSDSAKFLQGQVTCDINQLTADNALYGAQCNPKGRAIFSFLATRPAPDTIRLRLPTIMAERARQSLGKYIVFSKADISADPSPRVVAVLGSQASDTIEGTLGISLNQDMGVAISDTATVIRHDAQRFECWLAPETAEPSLTALLTGNSLQPGYCWHSADIQAGIATVYPTTSEEFVPQNINMIEVGAVSFTKGCYTGQEVVARMQYLGKGKQKRHTRLAQLQSQELPQPGAPLLSGDQQQAGKIVCASQVSDGSALVLAWVTDTAYRDDSVTFGDKPLIFLDLPYPLADEQKQV